MSGAWFFGEFLVERGFVTDDALRDALAHQAAVNVPLGALALSKGLLSERQVLLVHTEQRRTDRRFGELAVQMGFLQRAQLDELLREQSEARILIGEALVQKGHLTREALEDAFQAYRAEQAEAEQAARARLAEAPGARVVEAAVDITIRLLLRMGNLSAKLARVAWDRPLDPKAHAFWQRIEGDESLVYAITLSEEQTLTLGRRMLEPLQGPDGPREVDALVRDVLKEFVNVVALQLCARLGREGRSFAPGLPEEGAPPPAAATRVVVDLAVPGGAIGLGVDAPAR